MRTELPDSLLVTPAGRRADEILRACVHCGFCNATCPTYLLLGNELDGPRGRIYLIKDMLETGSADQVTRTHLDRCLTCRACETTCPSGVAYGELLEIGRDALDQQLPRPAAQRRMREWLRRVVPDATQFRRWVRLGHLFRAFAPGRLRRALPPLPRRVREAAPVPAADAAGRVLLLEGCVQQVATPGVNAHLRALLASRRIAVVTAAAETCCGSLALHLGAGEEARATMRRNLRALEPHLEGIDAILSTASGCGVTLKDYGRLLADDPQYAALAARAADLTVDAAEYLLRIGGQWHAVADFERVAWHAPCTLQHGQRVVGVVERLLQAAGYQLVEVADPHLCCGFQRALTILEPALSERLRDQKVAALSVGRPQAIATANIGCQLHLAGAAEVPVRHWLELLR